MRVRFITSSPTAFIMRSRRSREIRTDFACGRTCGAAEEATLAAGSLTDSFRCFLISFFRRQFFDPGEQRIDSAAHLRIALPLPLKEFFQHVYRLQADVDKVCVRPQMA